MTETPENTPEIVSNSFQLDESTLSEAEKIAYNTPEIQHLLMEVSNYQTRNESMEEALQGAMIALQVENIGWMGLFQNGADDNGLHLDDLKEISQKCREYVGFTDLMKRGVELRVSYVWSKGVLFNTASLEDSQVSTSRRGPKTNLSKFFAANQNTLFSSDANKELERLAATDGNVIIAVHKNPSRPVMIIPIHQISDVAYNPNNDSDIWAYQRQWSHTDFRTGEKSLKKEWYVTDRWDTDEVPIPDKIGKDPDDVGVNKDYTVVDIRVNRQVGWALGIPDAAPGLPYYKEYSNFMRYGSDVSEAMSRIIFKILNPSAAAAKKSATRVVTPGGGGTGAVSLGGGQDMQALNTAGRGYDFDSGRALAARLASSLEVSVIHLLSDPGAAGSSYGSASNLDMPTKRAMVSRQRTWIDAFERIIRVATKEEVEVQFPPLDDPDPYREAQVRAVDWASGVIHIDEQRHRIVSETQMQTFHDEAPDGVLLPNNRHSWERSDIDPKEGPSNAAAGNGPEVKTSTASATQGRSTGAGNSGDHDLRDDVISDSLMAQANIMMLHSEMDELKALIENIATDVRNIRR